MPVMSGSPVMYGSTGRGRRHVGLHRRLHLDRLHREDAARDKAQEAVDEVDARAYLAVPVARHGHIRAAERNQSPEQITLLAF